MNLIKDAVNGAAESMMMRFLRNAGVGDFVDHPKDYELTMGFIENGVHITIKKKEES